MALNVTQVNQAFLATLGRPAEGSAVKWGTTSPSLDALLNGIFIAENKRDFVESLYTELLGRDSDAEGKAFWSSLLANTSKEAVLAQFKAAVLAAGKADPSNADYQSFIAQNKAFVTTLYTNLLGREADAEGLEFWTNALTSGLSRGELLAQFTAAAMAGGADNDDYQTITAKLAAADAFSAKFSGFNADVTADEKKAALDLLKEMMKAVVAGSTVEDIQEEIDQIAGNYQNRTSQVFTKANDDDLDASESTAATTFRGTVNLIDPAKGTIQATDKVSGNANFTDTLVVNVTSDSTHKLLDLNSDLPASISDIEKLIVNNGSANVEGNLNDTNFGKSVSITGTGDVTLKVNSDLENLAVSSATKGDVAIDVNSTLGNYTGGNAGESVTVNGSIKKASLGAGDDTLVINGAVAARGAIDLGAGNDELVINSNSVFANNITLDGGAGSKDKLTLTGALDLSGVKSIMGFETIDAQGIKSFIGFETINVSTAVISAEAANGLKAKLTNGSILTVDANSTETTTINLSGLSVDKGNIAFVTLRSLTKETVTLSKTVQENIFLADSADAKNITIKGFVNGGDLLYVGQNDTALIATGERGADLSKAGQVLDTLNKAGLSAGTNYVAINTSNAKASYIWKVEGPVATRDNITLVANVDKALTKDDFTNATSGSEQPGIPTPPVTPPADITDIPADEGILNLPSDNLSDATKDYSIDLSTNKDFAAGKVTSLSLAGVKAAELKIENKGEAPADAVAVNVPEGAVIKTLTLGSATDNTKYDVTVDADAQIETIVTNNASNNIDISALPAGAVKVVNAGEGADTLTIGGEAAAADGFKMTGVEKLAYTGTTINSDAIFENAKTNNTLELSNESGTAGKELIIKAGMANDGNVDLSSLVNTENKDEAAAIEVTGVASGKTVTLSKGADAKAITETVTLDTATNVTIANAAKGDKISSENFAKTVVGEDGKFAGLNAAIADKKAYFVNPAAGTNVTDFATAKEAIKDKLAAFNSGDAIIAVNGADKAYVFAIKGADGGATATEVAIVNGKFDDSYGIRNGVITIQNQSPAPQPTPAELQATLIEGTTADYELTVANPVSIDKDGTILKLASDTTTTLKAAGAISLTVNATSQEEATLSFDEAIRKSSKIELVELQGTGDRIVDLANINATSVNFIKDGAADTTLDISSKTFNGDPNGTLNQFASDLSIDLGDGTDTVVLSGTIAKGAFTLANVEGIKTSGAVTVDSGLLDTVSGTTSTAKAYSLDGELTVKNFAANTTSIDFSQITAANDKAKLTLDIVNTAVTPGNLTSVKGGSTTDTLVVSGDYANLDIIEGIDALSLSADTTLKAKAITGDKLTINGAKKLTVDASGEANVNLAKLSKGTDTPTIEITNVGSGTESAATIALNKANEIAETITLAVDASGDKAVKITGLGTGDILKGGVLDAAITAPFVLFKPAGEGASTALKTNAAYWTKTNADVSTAANALAALGKVTLANQQKALVAFNTDNGTYIYSVSGKEGELTAGNFTLAAIVDDKINNQDSIANGAITFTVNDTPIALDLVTKTFASLGGSPLNLADLDTYKTANAITVNEVTGALSVSGANAQIEKVDAVITAATGKVTKQAGVTSAVNVYLGGSEDLNFSAVENDAIASGADKLYLNTTRLITLKDAKPFGENLKLDLVDIVDSKIAINGAVTKMGTEVGKITVLDLFDGVDSDDTITFTASGGVTEITGSDAKEKITLASDAATATINLGAGDDTIKLEANGSLAENATIDGGEGSNTLQLKTGAVAVDFKKITTLDNIQVIDLYDANDPTSGAKVAAAAVNGDNITLKSSAGNGSGALTIEMASENTALDISNFKNDAGNNKVAGVTITGATSGDTITLSRATDATKIAETIALGNGISGSVTVENFNKTDDKISFTTANKAGKVDNQDASAAVATATQTSITDTGLLEFKTGADIPVEATVAQAQKALAEVENLGARGNDVVLFKTSDNNVYLIHVGGTTNVTTDDTVVNLGTIDVSSINAAGNVISFT